MSSEIPDEIDLSDVIDMNTLERRKKPPVIRSPGPRIPHKPESDDASQPPKLAEDPRKVQGQRASAYSQPVLDPVVLVPGQDMRSREGKQQQPDAGALIAGALAPQLGSAPEFTGRQKIDERKTAVLNELVATALGYFGHRGYKDGVEFYQWLVDWELVISQSINGLARQHILKALVAGAGQPLTDFAQKPNIIARNIWARDWRANAAREGQIVLDEG